MSRCQKTKFIFFLRSRRMLKRGRKTALFPTVSSPDCMPFPLFEAHAETDSGIIGLEHGEMAEWLKAAVC